MFAGGNDLGDRWTYAVLYYDRNHDNFKVANKNF